MAFSIKGMEVNPANIYANLSPEELVEHALRKGEAIQSDTGALVVKTGHYTGRSPKDRFILDTPEVHDFIAWGATNKPMLPQTFEKLWQKTQGYLDGKDIYVFDGLAGADRAHAKKFRIINELATQNLFVHQLLVRPTEDELANYGEGDYTVVAVPGLKFDPDTDGTESEAAVVLDFPGKRILVAGTGYSGEIKKAVFTTMNYVLPEEDVLPMHCSANVNPKTGSSAIFFGLSGTGKTTLSADPSRAIVGDDEHGWSHDDVFNFEGGCYAKCIDLSEESEPEIYRAVKFGAVAENVTVDETTGKIDFADGSITDNTRVAYPVNFIPNAIESGMASKPDVVFFLTADAFGVLPPISELSPEAAMYHFVSGFTSKVAGTELGVTEPVPTFSSLFGEPFMPRPAGVYAEMLGKRLREGKTKVYLVNTGWAGGSAAEGASRIKLPYTRAMITAALNGSLEDAPRKHDDRFNAEAILEIAGVPSKLLDPKSYWVECGHAAEEYEAQANKLAGLFNRNFAEKHAGMGREIAAAGPRAN